MRTVIIGGGITGLAAAWSLARSSQEVTLIEPGPFGGLLRTEVIHGCVVECGADSWIRAKPWLRDLAVEAGVGDQLISSNEVGGASIFRDGRLLPLPRGLRMLAPTLARPILASKLIGWRTKLRMAAEILRRPSAQQDRSVSEFVRDHFGPEAVEYLAEPLFAGVYGGDPESLGAAGVLPKLFDYERRYGSVIRGARREPKASGPIFESLRGGLGEIPSAIVDRISGRVTLVRSAAQALEPGRVRTGGEWMPADRVLLACGAPAAAELLSGSESGARLAAIPHRSATIFAFAFRSPAAAQAARGSGFLVPRSERRTIMGATWVSNKFSHRAPEGVTLMRCFAGADLSEAAIPDVLSDLQRITGITDEPWFSRVYRWPDSMPQYGVGHAARVAAIEAGLPDGIRIAGAIVKGVGMPDCARSGIQAADALSAM